MNWLKNLFKPKPKLKFKTSGIETVNGIKIHFDWNDQFIEMAKSKGCYGDDHEIVIQYLVYILRGITGIDPDTGDHAPDISHNSPLAFAERMENGNRLVK